MDILVWLLDEALGRAILSLVSAGVGATVLNRLKSHPLIEALKNGAIFGVAIFIVISLLVQVLGHTETPESVALPRPYFIQKLAMIEPLVDGNRDLVISIQNNTDVPANKVTHRLLILKKPLDPTIEPLHKKTIIEANTKGPGGTLNRRSSLNPKWDLSPFFVLFQIRYNSELSNETHPQSWYLKFRGPSQHETNIERLFNATEDEKIKIDRYIEEWNISSWNTQENGL